MSGELSVCVFRNRESAVSEWSPNEDNGVELLICCAVFCQLHRILYPSDTVLEWFSVSLFSSAYEYRYIGIYVVFGKMKHVHNCIYNCISCRSYLGRIFVVLCWWAFISHFDTNFERVFSLSLSFFTCLFDVVFHSPVLEIGMILTSSSLSFSLFQYV